MTRLVGIFLSLLVLSVLCTTNLMAQSSSEKIVPHIIKPWGESKGSNALTDLAAKIQSKAREQLHFQQGSVAQGQVSQLFYKTPSYYPCGYIYTAELTPLSGDPDLLLFQRVGGEWREIKSSRLGPGSVDRFTFTCNDINPSATNVDLDVLGYTAASYSFFLYKEAVSTGFKLKFPLQVGANDNAYNHPVTGVMDHYRTSGDNRRDGVIQTYDGQFWEAQYGCKVDPSHVTCSTSSSSPNYYGNYDVVGYQKQGRGNFTPDFTYISGVTTSGADDKSWVFYDGHTGYDYRASTGTPVYATGGGRVTVVGDAYNTMYIDHQNGYYTYYLHMSSLDFSNGATVQKGVRLGLSGKTGVLAPHLHITIKKIIDGVRVQIDPYKDELGKVLWE